MAEFTKLGKYEVRGELGRGAMGVVYEGYDPLIERVVALKTIRADQLVGENARDIVARFRREAQAAGRLSHPNIVSIYDFGEDAGVWYIAMEFIKGRELKEYFEAHERFSTADSVRILTQILSALGYSHKLGVIHRDIKPANIILLADGSVKVADFGIAHIESSELTQVGAVLGTPSYMSPEQIQGLPIDGRSDLFSVGVILYQFLTGERPFTGSSTITMRKVLEENPLPPSRFNVQLPGAMDAVVRRALEKRADDRYQSADEFAEALKSAAKAQESASTDPTLISAPPATVAPTAPNPVTTLAGPTGVVADTRPLRNDAAAAAPASPSKSNVPVIAAAVVVAALALGGGWYALRGHTGVVDGKAAQSAAAPSDSAGQPAAAPSASAPAVAVAPKVDPGKVVISAVGLIDPSDARYKGDKSLAQSDVRADSRSQLVEKALGLFVEKTSLAKNYDVLKDKFLANSGKYVSTVVSESEPQVGKDGLMYVTTEAVVDVRAVQKSLNQMSRDERIEFIRASGDPKVAVHIAARDADQPGAPPLPSPVAENILKERIKSFGFRTWSEGGAPTDDGGKNPDFAVEGEVAFKRLSARLPASGLVVTKYALNSWTIKAIDRETGEEIYYNTTLPTGLGSWATEEEALKAIGTQIGSEFSRDFFLQHVYGTGQKVSLIVDAMPDAVADATFTRQLAGLPTVVNIAARTPGRPRAYDLQLAGSGPVGDLVASGVLKPLNAQLGLACFSLGAVSGNKVQVQFDPKCGDAAVLSRLETNPPAGLYGAPLARQKAVIKDPEALKKLMI
jgi:eukaryotic-like serine/threonine-protein kinase